jgi:hypothetical protein
MVGPTLYCNIEISDLLVDRDSKSCSHEVGTRKCTVIFFPFDLYEAQNQLNQLILINQIRELLDYVSVENINLNSSNLPAHECSTLPPDRYY